MSLYVVDANVVAKWFVPEQLSEEAVRIVHALAVALECHLVTADERLVNALGGSPLSSQVVRVGAAEDFQ